MVLIAGDVGDVPKLVSDSAAACQQGVPAGRDVRPRLPVVGWEFSALRGPPVTGPGGRKDSQDAKGKPARPGKKQRGPLCRGYLMPNLASRPTRVYPRFHIPPPSPNGQLRERQREERPSAVAAAAHLVSRP